MHPGYAIWWISILAAILASDFLHAPSYVWGILLVIFLTVEGIALRRRALGDTFSELMWTFRKEGSDRRWIAWSVAAYIPMQFARIGLDWIPYWIPRWVLLIGVVGWLASHFNHMGRKG